MTISATAVRFDEHSMWVDLTDGRMLGVPLAWFPRLLMRRQLSANKSKSTAPACIGKRSTRIFRSLACLRDVVI
jgi:hypothetical protein